MDPFAGEFLDDYFAESEDHLARLRAAVLAFEEASGGWSAAELKDVQRSLHTLKGLAGMVGFDEVERAAHAIEDLVRSTDGAGAERHAALVPILFDGIQFLDEALGARKNKSVAPGGQALIDRIAGATTADAPSRAGHAAPSGETATFEVRFTPTPEGLARGLGVEAVRERLAKVGPILGVTPRIPERGGGVVFHFLVAAPPGWEPDASWGSDGLEWDRLSASAAESISEPLRSRGAAAGAPSNVVRVDLARLDELMRLVGELVISRARLEDGVRGLARSGEAGDRVVQIEETSELMERQLRTLREGVMRVRLVPVGEVFERLRFAARDVARESGKDVLVDVVGAETEVDRLVVDRMMEPLLHLVRNAISHGIEPADERARAGKPRQGRLSLRAAASGDRIRIEVEDDGRGVDRDAVLARAEATGAVPAGANADDARILELLCTAGFSTRAEADRTSGRGVGMDVVRSTVRALNGELAMSTELGRGTRFAVELPLTLMIVDALIVRVGDQTMAVPQPVLREVLKVESTAVTPIGDGEIISYRGGVLPLVRLARVFGREAPAAASFHVLVVGDEGDRVGLVVEGLAGLREIVVHPVDDPLVATDGVSGATELNDGRLGLILDAAALSRGLRAQTRRTRAAAIPAAEA